MTVDDMHDLLDARRRLTSDLAALRKHKLDHLKPKTSRELERFLVFTPDMLEDIRQETIRRVASRIEQIDTVLAKHNITTEESL